MRTKNLMYDFLKCRLIKKTKHFTSISQYLFTGVILLTSVFSSTMTEINNGDSKGDCRRYFLALVETQTPVDTTLVTMSAKASSSYDFHKTDAMIHK